MSTHDVISLMIQFGSFLISAMNLIMTIFIYLWDKLNKKK